MARTVTKTVDLDTGVVTHEVYRKGRLRHRDPREGPAVIERDAATGKLWEEQYLWHGRPHREDGPALTLFYGGTDQLDCVCYFSHGVRHRDPKEGPAEFSYRNNGTLGQVDYYVNGVQHRDPADGPATIMYDESGDTHELYYVHGERVEPPRPGHRRTPRRPVDPRP